MDNKPKTTPKDFFLHVGAIAGLYWSAGALIALLYQLIDYAFPDKLASYGDPYSAGIKFAIASLLVIFPIFLWIGSRLQKEFDVSPEKRELPIRKWLVYLTLFIVSIVIIVDLITLINTFLGGEITMRFALKALATFVVAGLIFGYFLSDIRRPENSSKRLKIFGLVAAILVATAIIFGFVVMGSPSTQRKIRFDSVRVGHLQSIQSQIIEFWRLKQALPQDSSELNDPLLGFKVPVDPRTDTAYAYRKVDTDSFELCADFELPTPDVEYRGSYRGDYSISYPAYPGVFEDESWKHDVGKTCFTRDIDPDKIPPYEKPFR